jgi:hypothetical protein
MGKTKLYTDVMPLDTIALKLGNYLQENKDEVSYSADKEKKTWFFIQTRKHGYLKLSHKKCINITIQGTREKCSITVDTGMWGENTIDFSNPPTLLTYEGIMATDKKSVFPIITEGQIWKYLDKSID